MIRDYDQIMTEWQIRQGACACVCVRGVKAAQTVFYQIVIFASITESSGGRRLCALVAWSSDWIAVLFHFFQN